LSGTKLFARQAVDHSDIGSGVPSHQAVGLEGDEPALIPALGGKFFALQSVVRVVAVSEGIEIDHNEHSRPDEPLGEEGKGLTDLGMEFVYMKPNASGCSLDTAGGYVEVVNESMRGRMANDTPVALSLIDLRQPRSGVVGGIGGNLVQ
jgi:hypothetical protein